MHPPNATSIFSWHPKQLESPFETMRFLHQQDVHHIYQYVSPKDSHRSITSFLQTADTYRKTVYFLTGEAEWALDEQATEVRRFIQWASQYQPFIKGIVLDIEPHTLKDFPKNAHKILRSFVKCLKTAYSLAKEKGLEIIVCLPYFLDTEGFTKELDLIIREAADAVAIMNYYREKEIEHIQMEARLSCHYGKRIYTIYELQPPGKQGLSDQNTYYNQGLQAVYQNYGKMKTAYASQTIHLSFHDYQYFKELAEKEGARGAV